MSKRRERTADQINNLRRVFARIHPIMYFAPTSAIDIMADALEGDLNRRLSTVYPWSIQIMTVDHVISGDTDWKTIPIEPKTPSATNEHMIGKCQELVDKYDAIVAIKITNLTRLTEVYGFVKRPLDGEEA